MNTPINNGILQSNLDANGYSIINVSSIGNDFNVKAYGAIGDGTTDDTSAIQDALADIPVGGGVLYFPPGVYKYTGATITLDRQITVRGDGGGVRYLSTAPIVGVTGERSISTIDFNSSTGTLFTVTAHGCAFRDFGIRNTSVTTPTAGAAISVTAGGDRTRYENISIDGFYVNIDVQAGSGQSWDGCWMLAPVLYALKLANLLIHDAGDHFISNCYFCAADGRSATSGIRIESGGGVKIINCKFNTIDALVAFAVSIDLAVQSNVQTSDLLVSNCSIESFTDSGIKGTTTGTPSFWGNIVITGNQIFPYIGTSAYGIRFEGAAAGDFNGVMITGNWGNISSSSNPFIRVANCSNVVLNGNSHYGFSANIVIGSGVTFASVTGSVPAGGTTGQSLKKLSNTNYDVGWA